MKKILLALLLLPAFSFAQDEKKLIINPNEVGLDLFSITRYDSYKDMLDKRHREADFNIFSGVYYKYRFNKSAFRASFDYTQKSVATEYNSDGGVPYYYSSTGIRRNTGISAGYERSFFSGKLTPYVFADAIFNYQDYTGHATYYGDFTSGMNEPFSEETFEYGLQGGMGLHYAINPFMSVSLETNAQGFVSVFQDVQHAGEKSTRFGGHFNPVSKLGFAVSF